MLKPWLEYCGYSVERADNQIAFYLNELDYQKAHPEETFYTQPEEYQQCIEQLQQAKQLLQAWNELQGTPSYCERWARVKRGLAAVCEACGEVFEIKDGYYEAVHEPTYAYCKKCCHW